MLFRSNFPPRKQARRVAGLFFIVPSQRIRGNGPTPSAGPEEEPDGHTEKRRRKDSRPAARKSPHGEPESKTRPRKTDRAGRREDPVGKVRPGKHHPASQKDPSHKSRAAAAATDPAFERTGRARRAGPVGRPQDRKKHGPGGGSPPFRRIVFGPGSSDEEKSSTHARPETTPAFACSSPERTAHLHGPACSDPACPAGRPAERTAVPDGKRTRRSDTRSEDRFFSMYVTLS